MNIESLLKSISNILKKNESFLNDNPEMFHAIQYRLFKAFDDDEENPYYNDDDEGSDYDDWESKDDLLDKPEYDKERPSDYKSDYENDYEDDEADRYLREHDPNYKNYDYEDDDDSQDDIADDDERYVKQQSKKPTRYTGVEDTAEADAPTFGDYTDKDAARESDDTLDEDVKQSPRQVQPDKIKAGVSSGEYRDWSPDKEYPADKADKIKRYMDKGFSHREAVRLAGAHSPMSLERAKKSKVRPSQPSPKMLSLIRGMARDFVQHSANMDKLNADPGVNPILHASGKSMMSHQAAYRDYDKDKEEFLNKPEIQNLDPFEKDIALMEWEQEWHANEDNMKKLSTAAAQHGKHYRDAKEARKQTIQEVKDTLMDAGKSFAGASTAPDSDEQDYDDFAPNITSRETAAHMLEGDRDEDKGPSVSIEHDPFAYLAQSNPDFIKYLESTRTSSPDAKKQQDYTSREPTQAIPFSLPTRPKEVVLPGELPEHHRDHINDLLEEWAPEINRHMNTIKSQYPTGLDHESLNTAGYIGLLSALHRYDPNDSSKASFRTYLNKVMPGIMKNYLRRLPENAKAMMAHDMKKKWEKGQKANVQAAAATASSVPTSPAPSVPSAPSGPAMTTSQADQPPPIPKSYMNDIKTQLDDKQSNRLATIMANKGKK